MIIGDVCLDKIHIPATLNVKKTYVTRNRHGTIFEPCLNHLSVREHELYESDNIGQSVFKKTKDDDKIGMSVEDRQFIQIMESGLPKTPSGNWIAPLPFRPQRQKLPNNKPQAEKRA